VHRITDDKARLQYLKKKSVKTSKGYRLNPETHLLIRRIQELISGDQEMAIGNACKKYYSALLLKKKTEAAKMKI
jgi:hypothetical protein